MNAHGIRVRTNFYYGPSFSRSHLQPALNILEFGMNEEYDIWMTCIHFKSCRLSNIKIRYSNIWTIFFTYFNTRAMGYISSIVHTLIKKSHLLIIMQVRITVSSSDFLRNVSKW